MVDKLILIKVEIVYNPTIRITYKIMNKKEQFQHEEYH
jgi:hypothetical protein